MFSQSGIPVDGVKKFTGHFSVDAIYKHGVEMIITYKHTMPILKLRSPDGTPITGYRIHHDANIKMMRVHFDGTMVIILNKFLSVTKGNTA